MTDYDEEPSPEELHARETEHAARRGGLRIEGLTEEHVRATLVGIVEESYGIRGRVDEEIKRAIKERVSAIVDETIRERCLAAVDEVIANGVAEFDSYSGREKSRRSVAELVVEQLTGKYEDRSYGYCSEKRTPAEHAIGRAVYKLFEKELSAELEKLKAGVKAKLDAVFAAKVAEALKAAIGVK